MTASFTLTQVLLLLCSLAGLSWGQSFNGFINPVFLPRGSRDGYRRGGRLYDPYSDSLVRGLDFRNDDIQRYPNQYYDYRSYPSSLDGRVNGGYRVYPEDLRYQSSFGLGAEYDRGQLLNRGQLLGGSQILDRGQLLGGSPGLDRGQLLGGSQIVDRGQFLGGSQILDRGQFLGGSQGLDRGQFLGGSQILDRGQLFNGGRGLDRGQFLNTRSVLDRGQVLDRSQLGLGGQILSTASPEISVTVQPNGST